jgi:hypothetical protein
MAEQTSTVVAPSSGYLSIVGIAPVFQGRGLGGTLNREQHSPDAIVRILPFNNISSYSQVNTENDAGG